MLEPQSAASTAVAPGRYRIDPDRTQVRYTSKHMFGLGTVHATFSVREGDLRLGDAPVSVRTRVALDAASFTSDSSKRDRDVRSAGLLDAEHFPDITFASDHVQETSDGWLVPGTVTAHGRSVPIDVQVDRLVADGPEIRVHGWARSLDRTAFGITGARGMVGRHLDLELDVVATPTP